MKTCVVEADHPDSIQWLIGVGIALLLVLLTVWSWTARMNADNRGPQALTVVHETF